MVKSIIFHRQIIFHFCLLPPAFVVCGKIIFSAMSVYLSVHWEGCPMLPLPIVTFVPTPKWWPHLELFICAHLETSHFLQAGSWPSTKRLSCCCRSSDETPWIGSRDVDDNDEYVWLNGEILPVDDENWVDGCIFPITFYSFQKSCHAMVGLVLKNTLLIYYF